MHISRAMKSVPVLLWSQTSWASCARTCLEEQVAYTSGLVRERKREIHYVHPANKAYQDGIVASVSIVQRTAARSWLTAF